MVLWAHTMATQTQWCFWPVFGLCCWISLSHALVGSPIMVQWTKDIIFCGPDGLVVIEDAFYTTPSPEVCDDKCRQGPKAQHDDECYFSSDHICLQRASSQDVSRLYDFCWPMAAPSSCNFTEADLPESMNVGYSCVHGEIFDPYNRTFTWIGQRMTYAFQHQSTPSTTMFSHCRVVSDAQKPAIKITVLKSPSWEHSQSDNTTMTSEPNDLTFLLQLENVTRRTVPVTRFPQWWVVRERQFLMQFTMSPTSSNFHPFWVMLEDYQNVMEVLCTHKDTAVTSLVVPPGDVTSTLAPETDVSHSNVSFSLQDLLVAVGVTCVVIIALVVTAQCLLSRHRRRKKTGVQSNYDCLDGRVEYQNSSPDDLAFLAENDNALDGGRPRGHVPRHQTCRMERGAGLSNAMYCHNLQGGVKAPETAKDTHYKEPKSCCCLQATKDTSYSEPTLSAKPSCSFSTQAAKDTHYMEPKSAGSWSSSTLAAKGTHYKEPKSSGNRSASSLTAKDTHYKEPKSSGNRSASSLTAKDTHYKEPKSSGNRSASSLTAKDTHYKEPKSLGNRSASSLTAKDTHYKEPKSSGNRSASTLTSKDTHYMEPKSSGNRSASSLAAKDNHYMEPNSSGSHSACTLAVEDTHYMEAASSRPLPSPIRAAALSPGSFGGDRRGAGDGRLRGRGGDLHGATGARGGSGCFSGEDPETTGLYENTVYEEILA